MPAKISNMLAKLLVIIKTPLIKRTTMKKIIILWGIANPKDMENIIKEDIKSKTPSIFSSIIFL